MFELKLVRSQVQIIGFDERDAGRIVSAPHDGRVGTWGQIRFDRCLAIVGRGKARCP